MYTYTKLYNLGIITNKQFSNGDPPDSVRSKMVVPESSHNIEQMCGGSIRVCRTSVHFPAEIKQDYLASAQCLMGNIKISLVHYEAQRRLRRCGQIRSQSQSPI